MKLRTFTLLRRNAMCATWSLLVLSAVAWVGSLWGITWYHRSGLSIWLIGGELIAHNEGSLSGQFGVEMVGYRQIRWSWPHWSGVNSLGYWVLVLPFWLGIAVGGTTLGLVTFWGRRTLKRMSERRCLSCAYDLTGLTGPCPECGSEQERKA